MARNRIKKRRDGSRLTSRHRQEAERIQNRRMVIGLWIAAFLLNGMTAVSLVSQYRMTGHARLPLGLAAIDVALVVLAVLLTVTTRQRKI